MSCLLPDIFSIYFLHSMVVFVAPFNRCVNVMNSHSTGRCQGQSARERNTFPQELGRGSMFVVKMADGGGEMLEMRTGR